MHADGLSLDNPGIGRVGGAATSMDTHTYILLDIKKSVRRAMGALLKKKKNLPPRHVALLSRAICRATQHPYYVETRLSLSIAREKKKKNCSWISLKMS